MKHKIWYGCLWAIPVIGIIFLFVLLYQTQNSSSGLIVHIVPHSSCGDLYIKSPLLPHDHFIFRTCEGILNGNKDFGLFQMNLATDPSQGSVVWKREGNHLSYEWSYPPGILVGFSTSIETDSLLLSYTITNNSPDLLKRVFLHPCLPTIKAQNFFPDKAKSDPYYTELYDRVFLWSNGQPFSMSENEYDKKELHLAFMKAGEAPIHWEWWQNSTRTFDLPLIAITSKDGQHVVAYGFEKAIWASCNTGDARACVHLFPYFAQLAPGQSSTVKGRLYILKGNLEVVFERYLHDFGKQEPE